MCICIYIYTHILCWLVVSTPLKNVKVNWDDDIPFCYRNIKHVPNHQPGMIQYDITL